MRPCMNELTFLFKSRTDCIWIDTYEEEAAIQDIQEIMAEHYISWKLKVWSNTEGLSIIPLTAGEKTEQADKKLREIPALFDQIRTDVFEGKVGDKQNLGSIVYVLRDIHNLMNDPRIRRSIRDVKEYRSVRYLPIIVIAPTSEIHEEVAKLFRVIHYDLPDRELIKDMVEQTNGIMNKAIKQGKKYELVEGEQVDHIINASLGLTQKQLDSLYLRSVIKFKTINVNYIAQEKIETIKKSGMLDYQQPRFGLNSVGGHNVLKEWFNEVKELYRPEAREFGLPMPKGALLLGVQGAGKSSIAEAIAFDLSVPLLKLDMSRVMDRLVGASERNIRSALNIVKATGNSVFLIDEVEKAIGGYNSSNNTDSGITARVFKAILEFLQDNTSGAIVLMTANDVSQLPPELTRSGRLDAMWFFDLPTPQEREEIFNIYLKNQKYSLSKKQLKLAIDTAKNYTGAEIKTAVENLSRKVFVRMINNQAKKAVVEDQDIIAAIREVTPVYESSKERVQALRNWVKGRARFTNQQETIEEETNTFDPLGDISL